jgi:predicted DNA-binding transcriptional regulator AlpA
MVLLLDFAASAAVISIGKTTLRKWAYRAQPAPPGFPAPVRVGRLLRYRLSDLESWVAGLPPAHNPDSVLPAPNTSQMDDCLAGKGVAAPQPSRRPGRPRKVVA